MTIKEMFWTLYIAGGIAILVSSMGYGFLAMGGFLVIVAAVYIMVFLGGTHNG